MLRRLCILLIVVLMGSGMFVVKGEPRSTGYIPGVTDVTDIQQAWTSVGREPKGTFLDWRNIGGTNYLTPVENQGTSNLCWTFATTHSLEAWVKIYESLSFSDDFSEDHMADCTLPGGSSAGGNFWKSGGYLSAQGPISESCQPWSPSTTVCLNCPQLDYRLKRMITIANTVSAIKAALTYGPVACSMDTDGTAENFYSYNGTFVLTNGMPSGTNHAVIIVGYHEGTADPGYLAGNYWICKNSWGTAWGDGGYFYIEYGAANIGSGAVQFAEWEDSLASQDKVILYEDDNGADGYYSGMPNTIYVCQRLTPSITGEITEIQWAQPDNNFDWEVRIYDDFSGGHPSNQLGSTLSGTSEPYGGYMYVDLSTPVDVTAGDPIWICVKLQSTTGYYPVCLSGSYSGGAYYSTSSITGPYTGMSYDWSVRAVVYNPYAELPSTGPAGVAILLLSVGGMLLKRRRR